jgi:hypothetical protein
VTATYTGPGPAKATCARCGKTVWRRKTGEMGNTSRPGVQRGDSTWEWCARKGGRLRPIECPVPDGWPLPTHDVTGTPRCVYISPEGVVR